jgi:rubrerythrin
MEYLLELKYDSFGGDICMVTLTCAVCGMKINEKNYNFNKKAFLNSNSANHVIYCPFCGAPIGCLSENGRVIQYDKNKLTENDFKIINHSVKLEVFNGDFYKEASDRAKNENVKNMFKDLSNIEYIHAGIHRKIAGLKEMPTLKKVDYSKYNTDEELLSLACEKEKHAVEYYKKYEKQIHEENVAKIFRILSRVEGEHVELTSK